MADESNKKVPEYLLQSSQIPRAENVALYNAAEKGSVDAVLKCLGNGGNPNFFYRPEDQKNSLHIAAEKGYVEICRALLNHGAFVDAIAATEQATPLHLASENNHVTVVELLLSKGANVNAINGYGNSSLHKACKNGCLEVVRLLLKSGADVQLRNNKGSTALHFVSYFKLSSQTTAKSASYSIAASLIDYGADVNLRDFNDNTPLLAACTTGNEAIIRLLLDRGADATVKNSVGHNAVDILEFHGHHDVVQTAFTSRK